MSEWSHLPNAKHIDRIVAHVKANPAARDAGRDAGRDAAWYAACALVAWDRSSDLMDSPADQVKVLAILGDQAAIMMYPAIAAMETTQELA